jgi:hypothetical protein
MASDPGSTIIMPAAMDYDAILTPERITSEFLRLPVILP